MIPQDSLKLFFGRRAVQRESLVGLRQRQSRFDLSNAALVGRIGVRSPNPLAVSRLAQAIEQVAQFSRLLLTARDQELRPPAQFFAALTALLLLLRQRFAFNRRLVRH